MKLIIYTIIPNLFLSSINKYIAIINDTHDNIIKNNTTDTYDDASADINAINNGIKKNAKF